MQRNLSDSDSDVDQPPSFDLPGSKNSRERLIEHDFYPTLNERPGFGANSSSASDDNDERTSKRPRFNGSSSSFKNETEKEYDSEIAPRNNSKIALGIMERMGFSAGKGLGKYEQGRVEPVQASNQKGRRGLGHDNKLLLQAVSKWDPSAEVISVEETILWLDNSEEPPTADDMKEWMVRGPRKEVIDDETLFCDSNILTEILNSKSVFNTLDKNEKIRARTRSNPYETIRNAFFLNRAAVKMVNIDKACNFMFTQPKLKNNELLYFADVCAGPGGFSEYVLWRRKWQAKGFGFTLRESNDFKLDDFYAGSPETFHPYYGPKENGDVYDPENQRAFKELIMTHTSGEGVHFMMADGGFSVEGQNNIQEILSKQLYLCQCLVALMIVRDGGHFVTKLFDLFTPFSVGLVYLMSKCFKKISIFKPNTSRPANSERYLICQDKLPKVNDVTEYLSKANEFIFRDGKELDVIELVPLSILLNDKIFMDYLINSNNSLGRRQIVALTKIAVYCENTMLTEPSQAQMRKQCLEYWELPDQSRIVPKISKAENKLELLVGNLILPLLKQQAKTLNFDTMNSKILSSPCDWYYVLCGTDNNSAAMNNEKNSTFYLGMGRTKVFKFVRNSWERVTNIELPPDTFVYAEIVDELRGNHKTLRKTVALHIIDAYFLGGDDISRKSITERYELINMFCKALWKPEYKECHPVRVKELHPLDRDLKSKLTLQPCTLKNGKRCSAYYPDRSSYLQGNRGDDEPLFFIPNTIMLLKETSAPWSKHISKTTGYHYYFHPRKSGTFYAKETPSDAHASFSETFSTRMQWNWLQDQTISIDYLHENVNSKCLDLLQKH